MKTTAVDKQWRQQPHTNNEDNSRRQTMKTTAVDKQWRQQP
jgi:hypothetical protein